MAFHMMARYDFYGCFCRVHIQLNGHIHPPTVPAFPHGCDINPVRYEMRGVFYDQPTIPVNPRPGIPARIGALVIDGEQNLVAAGMQKRGDVVHEHGIPVFPFAGFSVVYVER
jgi:hypothetical protein